jgi:hypothetical protein
VAQQGSNATEFADLVRENEAILDAMKARFSCYISYFFEVYSTAHQSFICYLEQSTRKLCHRDD